MKNSLISIIVPIYNVEPYLHKCVDSILSQTYSNLEIILVDDGSPDNCGKICDEYAQKDNRIKVIHKKNGGLAAARNSGQDVATGEALMFLDGDDYLESNCVEEVSKALFEKDVELVMFDQYINYPNSQQIQYSFNDDKGSRLFTEEDCRKLQFRVLDFNGKIAMVFMKLIRTDYLRKYNIRHIDELKQGAEGFVFNIQLFEHLKKAYYLHKPLLHYRYNAKSISHTANLTNNLMIVRCMEWIDEYVKNSKNPKHLHPAVLNRMLYVICTTAITGCFNPYNPQKCKEKIKDFKRFLAEPLVAESLTKASRKGIGYQRRIILLLIDCKLYRMLQLFGWIRRKQLENK